MTSALPPPLVYVVDDDLAVGALLAAWCRHAGFEPEVFHRGEDAVAAMAVRRPDALCLDLWMEGMDGPAILRHTRDHVPDLPVVVVTSEDSVERAVEVMRLGAFDYQTKPLVKERLILSLRNALEQAQLRRRVGELEARLDEPSGVAPGQAYGMVGGSPPMRELFRTIERVGRSDVTVMLFGESGTGKELVARAIHRASPRRGKPFAAFNCGAVPETLLESELFGHQRGAFTGATETRKGRFEAADGGTLFLDETAELSAAAQVRLLRVLQESRVSRVGSSTEQEVDVRIIGATHRDLEAARRDGAFRDDLYYRLMVYPIRLPPLRERTADIPKLAAHFLAKHSPPAPRGAPVAEPRRLSDAAMTRLVEHPWPGNVRELENAVQFALVSRPDRVLGVDSLPEALQRPRPRAQPRAAGTDAAPAPPPPGEGPPPTTWALSARSKPWRVSPTASSVSPLVDAERDAIVAALSATRGNVRRAAERLGIGRSTLYRKLRAHGLRRG